MVSRRLTTGGCLVPAKADIFNPSDEGPELARKPSFSPGAGERQLSRERTSKRRLLIRAQEVVQSGTAGHNCQWLAKELAFAGTPPFANDLALRHRHQFDGGKGASKVSKLPANLRRAWETCRVYSSPQRS